MPKAVSYGVEMTNTKTGVSTMWHRCDGVNDYYLPQQSDPQNIATWPFKHQAQRFCNFIVVKPAAARTITNRVVKLPSTVSA